MKHPWLLFRFCYSFSTCVCPLSHFPSSFPWHNHCTFVGHRPKTEITFHLHHVVTEGFMYVCLYLWVTQLFLYGFLLFTTLLISFLLSIHKCLSKQHCIYDNKVFLHALIYAYICFVSHWTGALNQIISKRWKFVIKHYTLFIPIAHYAIRVRFAITHSLFSSSMFFF